MNLNYLEKPDKLLDIAYAKARKNAHGMAKQRTPFYTLKGKEILKMDSITDYLEETLMSYVTSFPSIDKLPGFYRDLFVAIIDVDQIRIALSKISSAVKTLKKVRREQIVKIKEFPFVRDSKNEIKGISKVYFGRTSSIIKSLESPIKIYNDAVKKLKELPAIKTDEECYILAGLPNVGKSTILAKITTSKPKIANYPFTTKGLNVGYFFKKHAPIQVIDTPGLLDRSLHERNDIEKKAITAFQHLKGTIIFVIDPLSQLDEQKNLFKELKKLFSEKGFIVVINKCDLAEKEQIKEAEKMFKDNYIILEGKDLDNLKTELSK
ncbi:MAG: 50S ribosome-binding GTPase [Candidatus ainarchaeum sp.]|nr:50S ribosome-binding GTPase [Candidatus ainarchaeum sp.]